MSTSLCFKSLINEKSEPLAPVGGGGGVGREGKEERVFDNMNNDN